MSELLLIKDSVDTFHTYAPNEPYWTETVWFGAWIPEASISIYFYNWFRPVTGIYGGGLLVWDDTGHLPWDIPVYAYEVNAPLEQQVDLQNMSLPIGNRLQSLKEGMQYQMSFSRPEVELNMRFDGLLPPDETTTDGASEFFNGHIDQPGHYTGTLRLRDQEYTIDCHGIRDRSWGPRVLGDDTCLGYFHGQSKDIAFLGYSKPGGETEEVFKGYTMLDGKKAEIKQGQRNVRYKDGKLQHMDVKLEDSLGRTFDLYGRPLNRLIYLPYPNLVCTLSLMEWQTAQGTVYGEEQDAWSVPLWQQRREIPIV